MSINLFFKCLRRMIIILLPTSFENLFMSIFQKLEEAKKKMKDKKIKKMESAPFVAFFQLCCFVVVFFDEIEVSFFLYLLLKVAVECVLFIFLSKFFDRVQLFFYSIGKSFAAHVF
ncbi:hypothetical protein RFI_26586 [Reticulomyxa filosa]|uniref:Uncharacterized protein n=1 Tax=Reticulomyxa filosa TaxID=46433 RepID=X6MA64_RETFI|nr:hypothetical protein RFI_26586 [Reticulomyxa filosa]|eukprot:ETO10789.1 hypothetical protein RFI_26586 [Reticulomyxa filosa]